MIYLTFVNNYKPHYSISQIDKVCNQGYFILTKKLK